MSESTNNKAIAHIDCDAFFTSCEQAIQPRLKGRAIVTGKERGIISCASYEAKALGIRRGVMLSEARKLCPGLIILPSDYETYSIYSKRLFAILREYTPAVEEYSIDEAFCDLTGLRRIYRTSYQNIAKAVKERIHKDLDITVSVGLSLSKSLAKICSRYHKPDGLTVLRGRMIDTFLKEIPLEMVCGFGHNTVALLHKCGIKTVSDYIKHPKEFAMKVLGKIGFELWHELNGEAVYGLCLEPKDTYLSISKSKTFMPPSADMDIVNGQVIMNLESAFMKLRRHNLSARNLTVYLRTSEFKEYGLTAELNRHSSSTLDFTAICADLFNMVFKKGCLYRASGVILSDLVPEGLDSQDLFDDPVKVKNISRLSKAVDAINDKYGKYAVHIAASDAAISKSVVGTGGEAKHPRNGLPWRKIDILKGESFRKHLSIPLLNLK